MTSVKFCIFAKKFFFAIHVILAVAVVAAAIACAAVYGIALGVVSGVIYFFSIFIGGGVSVTISACTYFLLIYILEENIRTRRELQKANEREENARSGNPFPGLSDPR